LSADSNLAIVGEASNGDEVINNTEQLTPDIVLMDISMPGTSTLEVTKRLSERMPGTRVLILTMHEDNTMVQEYLHAGASGYILKRAVESELIDAIYAVWRGIIYIHPSLVKTMVRPQQKIDSQNRPESEPLTARELEILRYIVQGYTNRQIADSLNLSIRTVETHRSNLMDKLNLHTRVDLVRYASNHGII
jgi:two-component system response regulator NreC